MFFVGDIVRCTDQYIKAHSTTLTLHGPVLSLGMGPRHPQLAHWQRFEVTGVVNYRDGSQSLTIRYDPKAISNSKRNKIDRSIRGPFSSLRFVIDPESIPTRMFQYDPSQLGDLDDGI